MRSAAQSSLNCIAPSRDSHAVFFPNAYALYHLMTIVGYGTYMPILTKASSSAVYTVQPFLFFNLPRDQVVCVLERRQFAVFVDANKTYH